MLNRRTSSSGPESATRQEGKWGLRVVLIRLEPQWRTDAEIRRIARRALQVLPAAARVMKVQVHTAAEGPLEREWDLCILIRFASVADVERLRLDPIHRSFFDVFLKPMRQRVLVQHFDEYEPLVALET